MYLQKLVDHCDSAFTGPKCNNCQNTCYGKCEDCLNQIHFNGATRRYNCPNIVDFYTCKYIYKYSSEIQRLITNNVNIQSLTNFDVLSIGCGPCTDFYGIINYCIDTKAAKNISYTGVELNLQWTDINNFTYQQFGQINNLFYYIDYNDVINLLNANTIKIPNVLIMQYLISDMVKIMGKPFVKDFILKILKLIVSKMANNTFIILNDINLNAQARDYFEFLLNELLSIFPNSHPYKYHFLNPYKKYYRYGWQHPDNTLCRPVPQVIEGKYNPWLHCTSAQLLINILH